MAQDNSRVSGGSNENRRSLAEFLGLDTSHLSEPANTPAVPHRNNVSTILIIGRNFERFSYN